MTNLIGRRIGRYEILSPLGKGGMATVYRARQLNIKREVAIKIIKPELVETKEFLRRFEREAETIASLSHPHILKLFDYGRYHDQIYLVMELLSGGSLAHLVREQPLTFERASNILTQVASALDYAHRRGIIHRDLKPQNVLLDGEGNAHLGDFGLAKIITLGSPLTESGNAMGTPAYMSPEQWQGQPIDGRADIYALGIMLFEMLTGRVPFKATTPANMMYKHLLEDPPTLRDLRDDLPPGVQEVVNKAIAKDREERFNSANEFAEAFKAVQPTAEQPPQNGNLPVEMPTKELTVNIPTDYHTTARPEARPLPVQGRRRLLLSALTALAVLALIGLSFIVLSNKAPATSTNTSIALQNVTAIPTTMTPGGPPSEIASGVQTLDARNTAVVGATSGAFTATAVARQTLKATSQTLTPTPNLTASINAFTTHRAQTSTGEYRAHLTITATYWTPTATFTPTSTSTPTATLTPILPMSTNKEWTPVITAFDGVEMVLLPPGCFMMGSNDGETDEKPVNQQCFDTPLWIDRYEVTNDQIALFEGVTAQKGTWTTPVRPRENITWIEARDFCFKRRARLPTEAEWEYAARGPDGLVYPWGNDFVSDNVVASANQTASVGGRAGGKSWVGAYDLSGNVAEWVNSIYKPYPYNKNDGRENGIDLDSPRVLRGGSWNNKLPQELRSARRSESGPASQNNTIGFRCARPY